MTKQNKTMIQKNDRIVLEIEDIGADGEGIGKYEGMTFFVKDGVIGDRISATVMKLKKTYGYARLTEILEASPFRVEPRCACARACGGCQIQNISYEKQLEFKYEKVRNHLLRIGGFSQEEVDLVMQPIVGMEEPYYYRNKAQFPIGSDKSGQPIAGFFAGRTHSIIPNTNCALGVKNNEEVLEVLLSWMKKYKIPPYEEETQKGLIRHVLIRYGFSSTELMVALVINGKTIPHLQDLVDNLSQIPGMKSISVNENEKNTNVILGEVTRTVWGSPTICDDLYLRDTSDFHRKEESTRYQISPQSFYQINPVQTEKLYSLALEYAGLTGKETVWDLYCGIGTISLFLAKKAGKVYGVEIIPHPQNPKTPKPQNPKIHLLYYAFY